MIDVDWTFMGTVSAWQTVVTISVLIVALFVITQFLIRFWPWLSKIIALFDALGQLPAFIQRTDNAIADIYHEVKYNNGSSVKDAQRRTEDAVARIELGVKGLYDRADKSDAADIELRREMEDTRPNVKTPPPRKPRTKKEQ